MFRHPSLTLTVSCQEQLSEVVTMLEADTSCLAKDQDLSAMLEQAVGLATYLNRQQTAGQLAQLLSDPDKLAAIKDDPVIIDVLKKLLCMRKLAERDSQKRDRISRLQSFLPRDRDDPTLRDLLDQSDALIKPPAEGGKIKKSKCVTKIVCQRRNSNP